MADISNWLPGLVTLDDCNGNWENYLQKIYDFFCAEFVRSKPSYAAKRFAMKRHPMAEGKEATFWHLISKGNNESERIPDLRRCERIRWPRPMIEAIDSDKVHVWKNKRGSNNRIIIAVDDFSYVVVLDDRKEFVLLWTAYTVDRRHTREKLERECATWRKQARKS